MEHNTIKKDNRRALPRYLLTMLLAAIGGGFLGFAAAWLGHDSLSEVIVDAVIHGVTAAAPWAMLGTTLVSLAVILWLYRGAKGLFESWDGEEETVMDRAEEKLSWGLLVISVQMVLDLFFFPAGTIGQGLGALWSVLLFVVSLLALVLAQQKIVDLTRKMNPEKQGSVYDPKFQKKWFESCDEAEQKQIGQAAYKAFRAVTGACGLLWLVLILLSYAFQINILLPVFLVCALWMVLSVSYTLECIRLGKRG